VILVPDTISGYKTTVLGNGLLDFSHKKSTVCAFSTTGNLFYCWISDETAIVVAMVTPVSLALVFNVICFAKNIHAIRHLQQVSHASFKIE